jgi:hypothetical protein
MMLTDKQYMVKLYEKLTEDLALFAHEQRLDAETVVDLFQDVLVLTDKDCTTLDQYSILDMVKSELEIYQTANKN